MIKMVRIYNANSKGLGKKILISLVIILVLITLFSSFQTIKSGQVGLKVRFGKIVDTKLDEGLNLKIPYQNFPFE